MSMALVESILRESPVGSEDGIHGFGHLRSVQWRIHLGILPPSFSSIYDLRRVTADSRRRYAGLRRRLLVDPHLPKDGSNSPNLVMDNPLSQNPDSMWGRFFRNAELEKTVDQDLSRLYPEHGSYFQTPGCQGMLRRILLLWCLRHPEYGYRQGMHELLAPLLYVLHVDVERLSEVRTLYRDQFADKFDGLSLYENDSIYNFELKKFPDSMEDEICSNGSTTKASSLDELDPEIQTIVLLSDAYGAEGELGIVLSEKFMEHDAYCMFDALMSGAHGAVAMADFFSPSSASGSQTGLPPVIEASSALYHLLSIVDPSLHSHLVELGVEPQYFALRWLRVLFGREFSLEDLLIIWDEIFAADNAKAKGREDDAPSFGVLCSSRGAFISAMAISMLLHLRSSLLATENATSCLQRLLNFPENINLKELTGKAKSLQVLALDANLSPPLPLIFGINERSKSVIGRAQSLSSDSTSPKTPLNLVPDSYWEEKWRVLHKEEELKKGSSGNSSRRKGWSEKLKLGLSRTESDPSPSKVTKGSRSAVRRSLLDDLSRKLGAEDNIDSNTGETEVSPEVSPEENPLAPEPEVEGQVGSNKMLACAVEERCLSANTVSDENSSIFSPPTSPLCGANGNETEKSSVGSNLSLDENEYEASVAESLQAVLDGSPLPVSDPPENLSPQSECKVDSTEKSNTAVKDRKHLPGKFPWFWKFGRNAAAEGTSEKGGASEAKRSAIGGIAGSSMTNGICSPPLSSKGESVDQNMMATLRNLGQSMLENIQVIESALQQDHGQVGFSEICAKSALVGKGQITATAALKELRKISNILSEM